MKFIHFPDFDAVASALNFDTPDCHVLGGCDLYTTKAAGSDKKLYRNIDKSLESQHESLVRMSSSFSPPDESLNLSRASPFGPLSQISSRRTFAYLIATLNASHPDYDFSHILRPSDFRMERNLRTVMSTIDSTLYNLRPSPSMSLQFPSYMAASAQNGTDQAWGPQMWTHIDNEMALKDCCIYAYEPMEDPYEGEEGTIWSLNYFFFNKQLKRVAYLYVRGVPVLGASRNIRGASKRGASGYDVGANKRARYWLGDRADDVAGDDSDDEIEADDEIYDEDDCDDYDDEPEDSDDALNPTSPVRAVSEDIAARMEIEV